MIPLVVNVEKVRVEASLDDTRQDNNGLRGLAHKHAPNPIHQVKATIGTQRHEIMRGDGLGFTGLLQCKELGEDGHGL